MSLMLSPIANKAFCTSAGVVYTADALGIIRNVGTKADQDDLVASGCAVLSPPPTDLLFVQKALNFNIITDQLLTPTFNGKFRVKRYVITNASTSLTTAAGGIYTAASKGGTPQVAAGQVYSSLTTALKALELTLNDPLTVLAAATPLYFALSTPQGGPATGDLYAYGDAYV